MQEKRPDYDVVVIGTGLGGSAAGGISALHGLKTLILEKNPRPGGTCSYYNKEGFKVDTGAHMFGRGNKGPIGDLTKRLGMGTPIKFVDLKTHMKIMGMNIDLTIPRSPLAILYKFILPRLAWQVRINPIHYPNILHLLWDILTMKPHEIEAIDNISVEEFMLRYTKSEEIRAMIGGFLGMAFIVAPWEASAGESVWNLQQLAYKMKLGYPKGGASEVPETFLRGAKEHGADVRMKAGTQKIEVAGGKVRAVILENGERITTKTVISTTTVKDTVLKLTGEEHFQEGYVDRVKKLRSSLTAVQAKIGLKKKLVDAGVLFGGTPIHEKIEGEKIRGLMQKLEKGEKTDMIPIYAPIPTYFDPELAPPGCQLITAVAVAPNTEIELKDSPSVWIDGLMDSLNQMIPGLEENTIFCDTWSVDTLANWIGKSSGSTITTAQTMDQVRHKRPPHETTVKGLYLAGDCAGAARGVGTELACQSGMDCADLVASHLYNHVI